MNKHFLLVAIIFALTACAAPKPPSCDGANKRPINKQEKDAQTTTGHSANPASYKCV